MATTARFDLSAWRNDDAWECPLRVVGADLTNASLLMDVRLAPDTPGPAEVSLSKVTTAAQGVRVVGVSTVDDVPVTDLRIKIDRATMQALPYSGEVGDSAALSYALLIAGITRLVGSFTVLAHAYGSDAAPADRAPGYGATSSAFPSGGATLTIADHEVISLVIDGAGLLAASMAEVTTAAARAEDAAAQAQATNARASLAQVSPYQPAATFAGPLTREQLRGALLDADLSDWTGYNPAKVYSFATLLKSATTIRFDLWEQDSPGVYTDPKTPRLSFSVPLTGYTYAPNSQAVLKLTSAAGVGVIAVVPAALPTSDAELAAVDYGRAGLDAHVFRKGYGLFARLAGEKVLTADQMTSALVGAYAPSVAYVHPADTTERVGEGNPESFQGMGQSFIATKTTVVQRIETALFSAFGTPFKGKVRLVRQTPAQVGPNAGTLIQEFAYPAAVYPDTLTLVTDALFVLQPGEKLGVYATADAGYMIGMKRWDHPRTGEANPNGRVPLLFSTNGTTWSTGGVTSTFAYMQVPLRLYTNIASRAEIAALVASTVAPAADTGHLTGGKHLREFSRLRDALLSGEAAVSHVAFVPADSYTAGDQWVRNLARAWKAEQGNGGSGWTGLGFPSGNNAASNGDKAASAIGNVDPAQMAVSFTGIGWTGEYTRVIDSPDLSAATSSTVGDRATFSHLTATDERTVTLHYLGGSGVIRYRWNGGAWTTLNLSGSNGQAASLVGAPAGAWTLDCEIVSGVCKLFGIVTLTGTSGVVVHVLANNGSALASWARLGQADPSADRARVAAAWARLGPVRTVVSPIGPNDQGQQITYQQFGQALDAVLDEMVKVAWRGADYLHVAAPENGRDMATYPLLMAEYAKVAKQRVVSKRIAVLDMQPLFGADYAAYGDTGTDRQLFDADRLHPNLAGGHVYKPAINNALCYRS
ncbi:SGNH/GDSL hydrolase family protein [Sphingomonas hankookensis]|uniref:SGNH/GDSL hydrolase family protein n=1 Tax=Sphingomonas hankookensis TaxID=563996 RepID=UPI003D302F4D